VIEEDMPEAKESKDAKEAKECEGFEVEGIVKEILPGGMYRVELEGGPSVIAYVCGRMRKNYIRIVMGDRVRVAFSPYGPQRGRIVYRSR
jgi:translation initiation factor IF-1